MYPSFMIAFNIAKETTISSALAIYRHPDVKMKTSGEDFNREDREDFFSGVSAPTENCVDLCSRFFDLPTYLEAEEIFKDAV